MIFYWIYQLGAFLVLHVPIKWAYRIGICLSDTHYIFAKNDRKRVFANLKAIFPNKSAKEIKILRSAMFHNFAKYLVDFLRSTLLTKDNIGDIVKITGIQHLDEALAKGKGVIVLTGHVGNWELGGTTLALMGYSIGAVALPHRHKKVDEFFNSRRQTKGMGVIPLGKAVRDSLNLLHENKILALAGDRTFNATELVLDFFGKPTSLPKGPAAFSLKTGAAIIPGFVIRNPDDTFNFVIDKPIEFKPSGEKNEDLRNLSIKCKTVLEDYIRSYPEQWLMFRKFWIDK